eukprot:2606840-Amphidinium_carterae.1
MRSHSDPVVQSARLQNAQPILRFSLNGHTRSGCRNQQPKSASDGLSTVTRLLSRKTNEWTARKSLSGDTMSIESTFVKENPVVRKERVATEHGHGLRSSVGNGP